MDSIRNGRRYVLAGPVAFLDADHSIDMVNRPRLIVSYVKGWVQYNRID